MNIIWHGAYKLTDIFHIIPLSMSNMQGWHKDACWPLHSSWHSQAWFVCPLLTRCLIFKTDEFMWDWWWLLFLIWCLDDRSNTLLKRLLQVLFWNDDLLNWIRVKTNLTLYVVDRFPRNKHFCHTLNALHDLFVNKQAPQGTGHPDGAVCKLSPCHWGSKVPERAWTLPSSLHGHHHHSGGHTDTVSHCQPLFHPPQEFYSRVKYCYSPALVRGRARNNEDCLTSFLDSVIVTNTGWRYDGKPKQPSSCCLRKMSVLLSLSQVRGSVVSQGHGVVVIIIHKQSSMAKETLLPVYD